MDERDESRKQLIRFTQVVVRGRPEVCSAEHLPDTIRPHDTLDPRTMRQQTNAVAYGPGPRSSRRPGCSLRSATASRRSRSTRASTTTTSSTRCCTTSCGCRRPTHYWAWGPRRVPNSLPGSNPPAPTCCEGAAAGGSGHRRHKQHPGCVRPRHSASRWFTSKPDSAVRYPRWRRK